MENGNNIKKVELEITLFTFKKLNLKLIDIPTKNLHLKSHGMSPHSQPRLRIKDEYKHLITKIQLLEYSSGSFSVKFQYEHFNRVELS